MASVEVDGLVLPVLVAGHPALEICNTRASWGAPAPKEYLHDYQHLHRWSIYSGLIPPGQPTPGGAAVLARALAFRDAYYAALTDTATAAHWHLLDQECREAAGSARLTPDPDPGAPLADWRVPEDTRAPLWAVARAAADLLTSPDARKVRACPGRGCGWLFLDPRGRRRWCTMSICGNRAKAARHAARP